MFVVRLVLRGTSHLSASMRQYALSGTAGLVSVLTAGLLVWAAAAPDDAIRVFFSMLPWIVASAVSGWYARP
ncbi:hypothetical protein [Hymenobacter metallilatus]|uniref:Uncharacterized protein n=1 Tax=Hymenobacter metallilatus TaxID=2493666 RepID=A0A428JQF7_9BACT|nr:hypothetical protein [Hymenobacter metallilatus]RSK35452.1 hypothetical protein EI290_07070 [Hymenobacter metallilatus]